MSMMQEFETEMRSSLSFVDYVWTKGKELSCRWIMDRIGEGKVLDVGGTTWLLRELQARGNLCAYYDAFPPPADLDGVEVHTGDMHRVGDAFARRTFDYAVMRHTLEHSLNPLLVLWQVNQLLLDGGRLIVVVPHHWEYWVWFYSHFNCLPLENWRMLFYRAGFRLVEEATGFWDDAQRDPQFVEYRFVLEVESRHLRLGNPK